MLYWADDCQPLNDSPPRVCSPHCPTAGSQGVVRRVLRKWNQSITMTDLEIDRITTDEWWRRYSHSSTSYLNPITRYRYEHEYQKGNPSDKRWFSFSFCGVYIGTNR